VTAVVCIGLLVGVGSLGVAYGLRSTSPSLAVLARSMSRPESSLPGGPDLSTRRRLGRSVVGRIDLDARSAGARWSPVRTGLAITARTWEDLVAEAVVASAASLFLPPVLWLIAALALVALPVGCSLPVALLVREARRRRRHVRSVLGTFLDLVVLGLAGGVGVEGALFAASHASSDWAVTRMARTLSKARDAGQSPWTALGCLGEELGVEELVELSATLQLAGTEGARIRQSLTARAVALRRHEQADAESEANAVTERLFLPGALLLVGFLLFVGYPAFSRIIGGF
jgi:tight adherence protein C